MNCTDFRNHLVARAEGLLNATTQRECDRHLADCAACREEQSALEKLHLNLGRRSDAAQAASVETSVMTRIAAQAPRRSPSGFAALMRWLVGAAAATAAVAVALLVAPADSKAQASDVLARGAQASAQWTTVHVQARMRTRPADNFASLSLSTPFSTLEMWKERAGDKRWRIEKPGRVAVMDGQTTRLLIRPAGPAISVNAAAPAAFDTEWLHVMVDLEKALTQAMDLVQKKGWTIDLGTATDAVGTPLKLVTITAPAGVPPGDYLENKFLSTATARRLYTFNDHTGQLVAFQVFVQDQTDYLLAFEVTRIEYDQTFAADVFTVALPAGVAWSSTPAYGSPGRLPNNEQYSVLTPEQAARAFFEACGREDWTAASAFMPVALTERMKAALGGLSVVEIGQSFTSQASSGRYVPYEIKLRNGQSRKHNLSLKRPTSADRWLVDGGL